MGTPLTYPEMETAITPILTQVKDEHRGSLPSIHKARAIALLESVLKELARAYPVSEPAKVDPVVTTKPAPAPAPKPKAEPKPEPEPKPQPQPEGRVGNAGLPGAIGEPGAVKQDAEPAGE